MKLVSILALGDSYTKGEGVAQEHNMPNQLVSILKSKYKIEVNLQIIAETGWRTDNLLAAIADTALQPHYDFILLCIGVNNQYQGKSLQQYVEDLEELINLSINLCNNDSQNLLVWSIPDYGYTPFAESKLELVSEEISLYNKVLAEITAKHHAKYIYITDITQRGLLLKERLAADNLHLSSVVYAEIAEKILSEIKIS